MQHEWQENASCLHKFIRDVGPTPPGTSFPRRAGATLKRLQINVGLFHSETHKLGMASTAAYKRGAKEQTAEHIITSCPILIKPALSYVWSLTDHLTLVYPLKRRSRRS